MLFQKLDEMRKEETHVVKSEIENLARINHAQGRLSVIEELMSDQFDSELYYKHQQTVKEKSHG